MNPYMIIGIILFFLAGLFGAEQYGDHARGVKDDLKAAQLRLATDKLISDARNANDALKTQLLEKANEEDKVVDFLANSHPASGLQLPARSCAGKSNAPTSSEPAGTGTLPVDPQIAFAEFTKGLDELALEADKIVEACRVDSDWIKSQIE